MQYKELMKDDVNIFSIMESLGAFPFSPEEVNHEELQNAFSYLYGERCLTTKIEESFKTDYLECITTLSKTLKTLFHKKWNLYYNSMNLEIEREPFDVYTETKTNKISSFDSSELLEDSQTVLERKNNINDFRSIERLEKLQNNYINGIIFNDIRNTIFKKIIY